MISFIAGLIELAFWMLLLALTIGLLSGFAVLVWRSGREILVGSHKIVLFWGQRGISSAFDELRARFPGIFSGSEASAEDVRLRAEITDLQYALATAHGRAAGLADLVEDLKRQVAAAGGSSNHALYGRVGLHPDAADYVVVTVRREIRRHNHPDTHPAGRKAEYTAKFQDCEQAFSEIWQQRGLQ